MPPRETFHHIDPAALQARWDDEAARARLAALRRIVRTRGPDGVPLWAVMLATPVVCILGALCAAILPGA